MKKGSGKLQLQVIFQANASLLSMWVRKAAFPSDVSIGLLTEQTNNSTLQVRGGLL